MPKGTAAAQLRTAFLGARYDVTYFQGTEKSHYGDYMNSSLGPSRMLADTLFELLQPRILLDMRRAVGHSVKRLRELGVEAYLRRLVCPDPRRTASGWLNRV